jgi:tricorn protease
MIRNPRSVLVSVMAAALAPALLAQPRSTPPESRPSFAEPAISPDGSEIAMASGGDLWTVPAAGGDARLLVAHTANESRPLYSPTGDRLAFVSDRSGDGDIYVLTLATGALQQITFDDGLERLDAWSRDGQWLYFSSTTGDIAGMNDLYRVRASGGQPMPASADRYTSEFYAAPSPDGQRIAFAARGNSAGQWWRNGRSHLDESELWLRHDGATPRYERLTERGAKQGWPMWTQDGRQLYFVSDRSGTPNIWVMYVPGAARQVTQFKSGRVLFPTITADGRTIVFERDFEIWKLDTASGRAAQVPIARRGLPSGPSLDRLTLNNQFQDLAISPDGRKAAFVARGELWATSAKDGGDAFRVTRTQAREAQPAWAPDSMRLAYTSERNGAAHLFLYDFSTNVETELTKSALPDAAGRFSPDGKQLLFVRDQKEVRVLDLASGQERLLASGHVRGSSRGLAWSPDGRWVAYLGLSGPSFRNAYVVPAAGGDSRAVSAVANGNASTLSWSPDGAYLIFNTSQRTEPGQVVRVDLLPRTPRFREDRFRDLFKEEPRPPRAAEPRSEPAPVTAVDVVFDDIRKRLSTIPTGVDVNAQSISPDGKWLLLTASAEGQTNLYVYSLDEMSTEPAVARQLTSTSGPKADAQFSPDSKEVYFLEQGRISLVPIETRTVRSIPTTAALTIDFSEEKMEVFQEAWAALRDGFYDEKFHGVDWEAVRRQYAPRVAGARTPAELRRILNLMVGELNSSHMGVGAPQTPGGGGPTVGKPGLRFDVAEYESRGRFKIAEVIPLGPAAVTRSIRPGEYLVAVDGVRLGAGTNLDQVFQHTVNRRVVLDVSASADGSGTRAVTVRPISQGAEKNLLYRQWVEQNRAYVDRASGGRLGYVHMADMSDTALTQLYTDLDADNRARDGVVVDVRNNNGGFVNVYAIDVLARRGYLQMTPRGLPTAPARTVLGQRALERPTILVTNQHSLSDAEDFTEGYRTLKLGKVVGEPTSGWIIYTGTATLIDGTTVRMPSIRISDLGGTTMELVPRPVDIPVTRPIGESLVGRDSQLDVAVKELLQQLGTSTSDAQRPRQQP